MGKIDENYLHRAELELELRHRREAITTLIQAILDYDAKRKSVTSMKADLTAALSDGIITIDDIIRTGVMSKEELEEDYPILLQRLAEEKAIDAKPKCQCQNMCTCAQQEEVGRLCKLRHQYPDNKHYVVLHERAMEDLAHVRQDMADYEDMLDQLAEAEEDYRNIQSKAAEAFEKRDKLQTRVDEFNGNKSS